jgi:hypothetical protein
LATWVITTIGSVSIEVMFKDEMHTGGKKMNYNSKTWSLGNNVM